MAITVAQSQSLWRKQHQQRIFYLNKWANIWAKYYNSQMDLYFENGNTNQMFKQGQTQEVLTENYVDVGTNFAKFGYTSVKNNTPTFEYKAASDELAGWTGEMIKFARTFGASHIVSINDTGKATAEKIIQQITSDAIEQGLGADETAQYIEDNINIEWRKASKFNALRIARTEIIAASNEGAWQGAASTGLDMVKIWLTVMDGREREAHNQANRQTVKFNEPFIVGGEAMKAPGIGGSAGNVINCYLPNTIIESNIIQGQKSFYSGEVIEIVTRRGESLTVTPNHSILTEYRGFVKAKDINVGDYLICNKIQTNPILRLVNDYIKKKLFTAQNIFSTLNKFWLSKEIMSVALDFDGDGDSMNGNINIVYPEVKLRNRFIPSIFKRINKFKFKTSNSHSTVVSRNSTFNFFGSTNKTTFRRLMSLLYLAFPLLFRHFRPLNTFRLGLASKLNSVRGKVTSDNTSIDFMFVSELINTDSGLISFDDVVNVRKYNFTGHVYDFTSVNGINIANNIYTSNCRCGVHYQAIEFTPIKPNFIN